MNTDFEVQKDVDLAPPLSSNKSKKNISPGQHSKKSKSPSLVIETNLNAYDQDEFEDGRIPTEVHYESDSADICEVKVDLIDDSIVDKRP